MTFTLAQSFVPLLAAAGAFASCMSFAQERLTILHTNDHHGHFWRSDHGEYGLAARKTAIDAIRSELAAQGGQLLLLDAGDVNTGVPESDLQAAEPDFRGMSALGYNAMAVGNHEFDRSLSILRRQREEWSSFPWLSANVYRRGVRMFEPYRIFQLGKLKVAVLGLTSEDTSKMLIEERFPEVKFAPAAAEAAKLMPELRQRADIVIGLTHLGHYADGKSGSNAAGDVELARAVSGFDAIVGGHSHTPVCMLEQNRRNEAYRPLDACMPDQQNGAWIMQASDWGKFLGRADFEVVGGKLKLQHYTLIPINLRSAGPASAGTNQNLPVFAEDSDVLTLLTPFKMRGDAGLSAVVGKADGRFEGDRSIVRFKPTSLGKLLVTAIQQKARADIALINSGAIRDSLPSGPLTFRNLLRVQPFGNRLVTVTMTGAELEKYVADALQITPGSGGYPQYTGFEMRSVDGGQALFVKGRRVDRSARYKLAVNSFTAKGGDGYPDLSGRSDYIDTGLLDVEVLREFVADRGLLRVADFEPSTNAGN
ncbi:MAG: bifunctional UDP-sugar hydrolase/5'-nucleotidase UshA [Pseudomonadota bacterium]